MAVVDFTTYTEQDDDSVFTVTSTKVEGIAVPGNNDNYVWKDYGAGYFTGDFEFKMKLSWTDATEVGFVSTESHCFGLTVETYHRTTDMSDNTDGFVIRMWYDDSGPTRVLQLRDYSNGNYDTWIIPAIPATYWAHITRVGTTFRVRWYSDEFSTLVKDHDLVCTADAMRYHTAAGNQGGIGTSNNTFDVENFDIVSGGGGPAAGIVKPNFSMSRATQQEINMYGPPSTGMGQSM